jgi:hypothetical protein
MDKLKNIRLNWQNIDEWIPGSEYAAVKDDNLDFTNWERCNSEDDFDTCMRPYIDRCYEICDDNQDCKGFTINYTNLIENGHKPHCYFYNKNAIIKEHNTAAAKIQYVKP